METQHSDNTSVPAHRQLAGEWRMYQSVESGDADALSAIWEADRPVVILGHGNRPADWVEIEACHRDRVDVLRRCSGGGAVVLGPGCLNYAVCLSLPSRPEHTPVSASFHAIHEQLVAALGVPGLMIAAQTDLAWGGLKVSGSAQRRGRRAVLHHGTLLYGFDAELAHRYLREPPRQPTYRAGRSHRMFMGNVPLSRQVMLDRIARALDTLVGAFSLPCRTAAQ
jgi:lipoate-protein ligase A